MVSNLNNYIVVFEFEFIQCNIMSKFCFIKKGERCGLVCFCDNSELLIENLLNKVRNLEFVKKFNVQKFFDLVCFQVGVELIDYLFVRVLQFTNNIV